MVSVVKDPSLPVTTSVVSQSQSVTVNPRPSTSHLGISQKLKPYPSYISPAFLELKVPEPKSRKTTETICRQKTKKSL